jgi:hypothetical protein
MARSERRVDLCDAADTLWRRGGRVLDHGKGPKRQSGVRVELEVAIDDGPNKIYVHLFEWPGTTFHMDNVSRNVTGAYLLADKARTPLKVTKRGNGLDVELPGKASDPIAGVLVLTTV